jgi:hypothetical protein
VALNYDLNDPALIALEQRKQPEQARSRGEHEFERQTQEKNAKYNNESLGAEEAMRFFAAEIRQRLSVPEAMLFYAGLPDETIETSLHQVNGESNLDKTMNLNEEFVGLSE